MIKGVNKRVVEITSTDHEYFEKAVLYVKADKSDISHQRITEEAREYLGRIVPIKRKNELSAVVKLAVAGGIAFAVLTVICLAILL